MKVRIIIVLALLAAALGGWQYSRTRTAGQGDLYGNVDIREVSLGFRVMGKVARLNYDEGDLVKAGEAIAVLDDEPYRRQVETARAQVESLRARLTLRQNGNRPQEIEEAAAVVAEREALQTNAQASFQRVQTLFALGTRAVTGQDRDAAEAGLHQADALLRSARAQLSLLREGFRTEEIAQSRADLTQAEAQLATAELQLKDTILAAPEEGVILTRAQEAGAILPAGATVFTLSLVKPVWVRAYIGEPELGRIHPGSKVVLFSDTHPEKLYHGKVGYISPRAEFTPKTVETTELRTSLVYRFRVVVEDADASLRQGMPVTVRLAAP